MEICILLCRSQRPRGVRRRSSSARLLRLWVRIPPVAWMFVCCDCCVLSGRGLCDELITRPEESYRLWRVVLCDQETSKMRSLKPAIGLWKIQPQWVVTSGKLVYCSCIFKVWQLLNDNSFYSLTTRQVNVMQSAAVKDWIFKNNVAKV
jgi:hypothetical protein